MRTPADIPPRRRRPAMTSRRTLILLGAIALGVLAAFALFSAVNGGLDPEPELIDVDGVTCVSTPEDIDCDWSEP